MAFEKVKSHPTYWLLLGLSVVIIFGGLSRQTMELHGVHVMPLFLHVAMETFAIVIAMLVFAISWNAYDVKRSTNTVILAVGFLAVGLLDFGHMSSFQGMPDFVTPSGPEKAIEFWLSGRFITALILLYVAFRAWNPLSNPSNRYALLLGSMAVTLLIYWLVLFHSDELPHTFIEGQGLTPLKIAAEYVIIAILFMAAVQFYRQFRLGNKQPFDTLSLFAACVVTILSELCFVLYTGVTDVFNLLGHIYKVIAYMFIYRAVFIDSVRDPFIKLHQTKNQLFGSQRMLQSIIDNVPVRIFWKNKEGRYLGANDLFLRDMGVQDEGQLLDRDDFALMPKYAARYWADDLEVMQRNQPKVNIEEPIQTADGHESWMLVNKVPLRGTDNEVIGILGAYLDITQLREAEQKLAESHAQLLELTINREESREGERKRIAQDLHDGLGQMLTSLRMELSLLRIKYGDDNPPLVMDVRSTLEHIDATIQMVRDVSAQLRPAVLDMGIASALEWQVAQFTKRSAISCELKIDDARFALNTEQATTIFRIVQESFTNIMRHAQASRVEVRLLQAQKHCHLEIEDDGIGFNPSLQQRKTFGLMGMRERALVLGGELDIRSAPGQGTIISICIGNCDCGVGHD